MRQRYYDPVSGRFLSADPVTTDPSTGAMFNRYNYVHNNPYRFVDPDGRAPKGCGSGTCPNKPERDWRSASLRARALAGGNRPASTSRGVAPEGARTFGPLKGAYTPATASPEQPTKREKRSPPDRSGVALGGEWSTKVHVLLVGGSMSTSYSVNGNLDSCMVASTCLTLGPGLFADTGPGGQLDIGNIESQGMFFGVTAEGGALVTFGLDVDFNESGVSISPSTGGGAGGMVAAKICSVNSASGEGCQ